ncbi:hypothetical protein [Roseateles puraquae]|nr:hypothetical protein [Roseateles puraquae]
MRSPVSLPRRAALCQLAAVSLLASLHAGCATAAMPPLLDLQLVDRDSGSVLAQYASAGRRYSPGSPGARYAIRLSNRTGERVLVVLSVDGVNAITGDTASFGQTGYVLGPWETTDIAGWRKSDDRIAAFEFTSLGDSYAARTGRPANVGVVGAAVFREVPPAPPVAVPEAPPPPVSAMPAMPSPLAPLAPLGRSAAADAAAPLAENAARAKLGTGHGAAEWAPITRVDFRRRTTRPEQLLEVLYDSQANLVAAGIMPRTVATLPRAFPDSRGGYVPDPPARW